MMEIGDLALHRVPGIGGGTGKFATLIFGSTRPENPIRGMLWMKCERPQSGKIHISHGVPDQIEDGDLWIRTYAYVGDPSPWTVAQSGRLFVAHQYPNVVTLRKDGMWTGAEAWLWDGTQWILVSIADYLYNEGIEFLGGWVPGQSQGDSSQSKEADHLYLRAAKTWGGTGIATWQTGMSVNLTAVSYINVEWDAYLSKPSVGDYSRAQLIAGSRDISPYAPFNRKVDSLNVSSLTGEHVIQIRVENIVDDYYCTVRVYKVWLVYS